MGRRKFTSEFKTKVVLEALKERVSLAELAQKHSLHPQQITKWKRDFLTGASAVFSKPQVAGLEQAFLPILLVKLWGSLNGYGAVQGLGIPTTITVDLCPYPVGILIHQPANVIGFLAGKE